MNSGNQRKIGAILSYLSIIITTLVQLIYTPLLIRMLGQSEYGIYSLVFSIIGYLSILDLGFGNAIVVYTSKYRVLKKYDEEKKVYGMFKLIFLILGLIVTFIGIILYFNIGNLFGNTMTDIELEKIKIMLIILIFNLFITFVFNIYSSIIISYEKFVFQKILAILNTILIPLLMIPLLFLGFKSITLCIVITIINILIMLSNYFYCRNKLGINVKYMGFDKKIIKEIFIYSFFIFLGIIVDKVNWSVDQFILGMVSGSTAISLYSVASQLNTLFINLSTSLSGVMLPKISKMIANNVSNNDLTDEMIKVGRIQYLIIFFMVSSFILFGKEFIVFWVGKKFISAYYIALILIIPLCLPLVQNLGISILQAKNMHKFRSLLLVFIALFNIILSIPLAKLYNGIGCAVGTAISLIIGNVIIMNVYYKKRVGLNVIKFWCEILKMTIVFILPITIIIFIMNFIKLKGILYLLVFGMMYTLIYSNISYFLVMNEYEKNIINKLLIRIHLKKG